MLLSSTCLIGLLWITVSEYSELLWWEGKARASQFTAASCVEEDVNIIVTRRRRPWQEEGTDSKPGYLLQQARPCLLKVPQPPKYYRPWGPTAQSTNLQGTFQTQTVTILHTVVEIDALSSCLPLWPEPSSNEWVRIWWRAEGTPKRKQRSWNASFQLSGNIARVRKS